jgi:hypothetical protein
VIEVNSLHIRLKNAFTDHTDIAHSICKKLSTWDRYHYTDEVWVQDGADLLLPASTAPFIYRGFPGPINVLNTNIIPYRSGLATVQSGISYKNAQQRDALEWLGKRHLQTSMLMLCMNMGSGKTFCSLVHAATMNLRVLIVADREIVLEHWRQETSKFLSIDSNHIRTLTGIKEIKECCDPNPANDFGMVLMTIQSAIAAVKHDPTLLNTLCARHGIGMIIFDEGHMFFKSTVELLCNLYVCRALIITGTPERSSYTSNKLYQLIFKSIPRYEERDIAPVEARHMHAYIVKWNSGLNDWEDKSRFKTLHGFNLVKYTNDWMVDVAWNRFAAVLMGIMTSQYYASPGLGKIAIVTKTNRAVQMIADLIENDCRKHNRPYTVGIFSTLVPDHEKRHSSLQCDIIVTTEKSFATAIDLPHLQILVNTVPFSSRVLSNQLPKRLRDLGSGKSCMYIDLVDISSASCRKAFANRRRFYIDMVKTTYDADYTEV